VVTGFGLAVLLGSRMPLPGNLAQGLLDALGCWALLLLVYTGWAHGLDGFGVLGRLTAAALRLLLVPVIVAALVVLASRGLLDCHEAGALLPPSSQNL